MSDNLKSKSNEKITINIEANAPKPDDTTKPKTFAELFTTV